MAGTAGELHINGVVYRLAHDGLLPTGRRALLRAVRPGQDGDPTAIRQATWQLSGPIGQSRERADGLLAVDYVENLDTRNENLLTSAPARNTLTIDTLDIGGTGDSHLGVTATLGGFHLGMGTTGHGAANAKFIQEHRDHVFVARGEYVTQVEPAAPALVTTVAMGQAVEGMELWRGNAYVGLGSNVTAQRRTVVGAASSTYEDVTTAALEDIEAGPMVATRKHLFFVDRATGADHNRMQFTLDDFDTVSNAFTVHDTGQDPNGMGAFGGTAMLGFQRGVNGFASNGDAVETISTVRDFPSPRNGEQFAKLWGWQYVITALGLRATIPGEIENNVGPGDNRAFEGPTGAARAIYAFKDSLWYAEVVGSDTYTYRGDFGPETAASGKPDWYPLHKITGSTVSVFGATSLRSLPALLEGEDDDTLAYIDLSLRAREIDDSAYRFATSGGTWFGSTLMRSQALHANLRSASFLTENLTATNTWQVAVSPDGGAYVNVGAAVTTNGHQIVRPVTGTTPLTTVSFHTLKPRLTQVADSATAPPQIRGGLTLVWDERPEMVEAISAVLVLGQGTDDAETQFAALRTLASHGTTSPDKIRLPGDTVDIDAFVVGVRDNQDLRANDVVGVTVDLVTWNVS